MSEEQKKVDEQPEQRKSIMQFTMRLGTLANGIRQDLYNGGYLLWDQFSKDDVREWLSYPQQYEAQLRMLSQTLYNKSQHYKRLVEYFAKMATFAYTIDLCKVPDNKNKKQLENQFYRIAERIENMNLSHELIKVFTVAFREDVFYGYEHETSSSYAIQQFNPNLCRLKGIDDGVFTFEFDLSYFDSNPDSLNKYPNEIQRAYIRYQVQRSDENRWYAVNPDKSVCFKVNEDLSYPIPPFAGVFDAVFDLQDFKDSRKVKDELGINKFLVHLIPIRKDSSNNNDFMIDAPTVEYFHKEVDGALPDTINLITTPMDIKAIEFREDNNIDNVSKAERDFFGASGVSQHLFNSESSSSVGLSKSIMTDELIVFAMLRQVERWLNRKIKRAFPRNYFKIRMLDVTHFNRQEKFDTALKSAQSSLPNIFEIGAIMGKSPSCLINSAVLENEIFKLHEKLVPLSSSHTQSAKGDKGGRPQKNENELTTEGIKTRDGEKNVND